MKADRGTEKGHEKMADHKENKKVAIQLESVVVQSVPHTKLCADIIRQGQGFLDDMRRKYALVSYKAFSRG